MKIEDMIAAVQKKLGVQIDGRAGPETWGAIYGHIVKPKIAGLAPAEALDAVDSRSEKILRPSCRRCVQLPVCLCRRRRKMAFASKLSAV